jgi:hypothetical protein
MPRSSLRGIEAALARAAVLDILDAHAKRDPGDDENVSTYLIEDVIYLKVGRRYPQSRGDLRAHLSYLEDRGYVKSRTVAGEQAVMWRITAEGVDILEGAKTDAGVNVQ